MAVDHFENPTLRTSAEATARAEARAQQARARWPSLDGSLASLLEVDEVVADPGAGDPKDLARLLGSYIGEVLRAQTGGSWGEASIFGQAIEDGVQLHDGETVYWAIMEARQFLTKKKTGRLSARCVDQLERAEVTTTRPAGHLYPLGKEQGYFDAGVVTDGRQVLMAAKCDITFALFFDGEGNFLNVETAPTPERPASQPTWGPSRLVLEGWQKEWGFREEAITVQKFYCCDVDVGIDDLPSHMEALLEDPKSEPDPARREEEVELAKNWLANGDFVLYFGNALWLDSDGNVTSS